MGGARRRRARRADALGRRSLTPWGADREEAIDADEKGTPEPLADDECRRLLESTSIGRLAFTDAALPVIMPVSYGVHEGHVVVAARRGSPVARALRGAVVALGVDAWDGPTRTGWSVNAIGPARVADAPDEVSRFDSLYAPGLPSSPDRCYLTVRIELLVGWRTARSGPDAAPAPRGERVR